MSQVLGLPKCFALRSKHTGKSKHTSYLQYVSAYGKSVHDGANQGKFGELISVPIDTGKSSSKLPNGEYATVVMSPHIRFFTESSKEHKGLVHVRCCYNNKYWVSQGEGTGGRRTFGTTHEPEEDLSNPSCTLFQLIVCATNDGDKDLSIRFLCSHLEKYASLSSSDDSKQATSGYLHMGGHEENEDEKSLSTFTVLDLSKKPLPKYFALKGDNDKYLCNVAKIIKGHRYLQFSSSDIGDSGVANSYDSYPGGLVIWNTQNGGWWGRIEDDWITNENSFDTPDFYFKVVSLGNYIALRNLANGKFCRRLTVGGKTDYLSACSDTITAEAKLYVEETVLSREIHDVVFHLSEARIHNRRVLTMATACCINGTTIENKAKLNLEYIQTESSTWDATVSMKIGVEAKMMAGIPSIANAEVKVSADVSASYKWGKTYEKSTKRSMEYELIIPRNTKVTLSVIATEGTCDVPFSYLQKDVLTTGEEVTDRMDDGIYYGVNYYDVKYETKEETIE